MSLLTILAGFAATLFAALVLWLAGFGLLGTVLLSLATGGAVAAVFAGGIILLELRNGSERSSPAKDPIGQGGRASLRQSLR